MKNSTLALALLLVATTGCTRAEIENLPETPEEIAYLEEIALHRIGDNLSALSPAQVNDLVRGALGQELILVKSGELHEEEGKLGLERRAEIVRALFDASSIIAELYCTLPRLVDESKFLVNFYRHGKKPEEVSELPPGGQAIYIYLTENYRDFLKQCSPRWQRNFAEVVGNTFDRGLIGGISSLVDDLSRAKLGPSKWFQKTGRPYTPAHLMDLAEQPPLAGFVLNMQHSGALKTTDNLKNPNYRWPEFERALQSSLVPLCKKVERRLEKVSHMFDHYATSEVSGTREAIGTTGELFSGAKANYYLEVLIGSRICRKIITDLETLAAAGGPGDLTTPSENLVERIYRGLVSESEPWL